MFSYWALPASYRYKVTSGRRFNSDWFATEMHDHTQYSRHWLTYSISTDKAYCFPCVLFAGHTGSDTWTTTGVSHWGNGLRDIKCHELSAEHGQADIAQIQWKRGARIDKLVFL